MNRAARIADLVALLRTLGHESALVGGLAVSVRARERFTKDIDLAVAVLSDEESEALAFAMQREGFNLTSVVEHEATEVVATLRFRAPESTVADAGVDLLCSSSGIEPEIVGSATPESLAAGIIVPVASIPHLIAMKVLAVREGREQDAGDLRALLAASTGEDLHRAEEALRLIKKRGFDRGKDLLEEFRRYRVAKD